MKKGYFKDLSERLNIEAGDLFVRSNQIVARINKTLKKNGNVFTPRINFLSKVSWMLINKGNEKMMIAQKVGDN